MKIGLFTLIAFFLCTIVFSQGQWDLKQCVDYATANNISVKQADVQARFDRLTLSQSTLSQYPNISSQHSSGYQFGRSIDPTSNQFTTNQILFANHGLDVSVGLFNWFSKKNTIEANKYLFNVSVARFEKAKNDIALNVANAYLAALLNKEQISISEVQLQQSLDQYVMIRKQVLSGTLPELNEAESKTQYATDSANLIAAQTNYALSLLQIKALLNLDADQPFEIAAPPVSQIPVEPLAALDPALVYQSALENLPQQKINTLNVMAAQKNVLVAKASMYPSLSLFGGLSTRYSNAQRLIPNNYHSAIVPIGMVDINGTTYPVTAPVNQPSGYDKNTYFRQLSNNFSQNLGVGLSIPIFNGGAARIAWQKSKLNEEGQQLLKEQDTRTLKQDIYTAHTNAIAAIQKFNASKVALESAQKAYNFAKKRFDVGLLQPIDLIINQNNLFRAKTNMLLAQYDSVFKLKLLEFYKGQGLTL